MTLQNALEMFIKLIFCFQQNDLIVIKDSNILTRFNAIYLYFKVYAKLSTTYYSLLETLTGDHISFIATLRPEVFVYILSTVSEGLTAFGISFLFKLQVKHRMNSFLFPSDSLISTSCCSALDHIITYLFKQLTKKKRQSTSNIDNIAQDVTLIQVYQQQPQVFQQMLTNVLNIVIFEDCRNQWSMSRPLLGLILLNELVKYF